MKKQCRPFSFLMLMLIATVIFNSNKSFAQTGVEGKQNKEKHQLAVFAALYLDSAYSTPSSPYKHGNNFPRYILPGIEFIEGVQMALDSLEKEGVPLEVYFFDTKAPGGVARVLEKMPAVDLIIGAVSGTEINQLANYALENKVPFISATFPNDAGVANNPYMVVLNSTLPTHFQTIYQYLQKEHKLHHVVYFYRKSNQDQWLLQQMKESAGSATGIPVSIKYVPLEYGFSYDGLANHLDSNLQNVCLVGSLDETFSRQVAAAVNLHSKKYKAKILGMPTWDSYRDLNKPEYRDLPIQYTAPLYNPRSNNLSTSIQEWYRTKFYSRPSDMVYWGYESTWRFTKLLLEYGPELYAHLAVNKFSLFTDYNVQPVLNKQTNTLDYFENKKVYLVTRINGEVTGAQ